MIELPQYENSVLKICSDHQLIEMMIQDEDRVPRNFIDECVQRGDKMVDALASVLQSDDHANDESIGYWWMRLHAVMILGLIPGEHSGMLMLECIDSMSQEEDGDLEEWFAGNWPALSENKPDMFIDQLTERCMDRQRSWFMRCNLLDAVLAHAQHQGESALEKALGWVAQIAEDEDENWEVRLNAGNNLLDFPRDRFKALLTGLAARQSGFGVHFSQQDINQSYANPTDKPGWERHSNPWMFYEKQAIQSRQQRWQQEAQTETIENLPEDRFRIANHQPYQRETPKTGRNDPCPCGSGKKYKKCCLQ